VCQRVRAGGEVLDRIELDRPCYACMLGGDDGKTLFMVAAKWFGPDRMDELKQAKTGRVLMTRVALPHAGWP
jgi:sugar lactone lactonase YvrE